MQRRVLWIAKGLGPGGAERLLATHAARHDGDDFDITCAYVLPWKDHLAEELERHGVVTRCVSVRRRDLLWPLRLARLVRTGDWDTVHIHSPLPGAFARLAVRCISASRRPLVVSTEHNTWTSHRRSTRALNRWTSRWNDQAFAVTDQVRLSMSTRAARPIETLRHGIDVEAVSNLRSERLRMRSDLGFDSDTILVGTVANFRPQKDYPNLLASIRLLIDRSLPVHLLAVGQGPDADDVAALVDELRLSDAVTLTGFRADATRVMAAVDIFTLASRWEGLPVAVMEATALGLPIVATRVGGLAEHFHDGVDALLVPPGDPVALADALEKVVVNSELRSTLASMARQRAADFDAAPAIRRIEAEYRSRATAPSTAAASNLVPATDRDAVRPSPRPRTSGGTEFRPATADDRPAVLDLCRAALGWGDDPRFEQLFAWKHDDNAFGPSYQWVAVAGDKVIGFRAFMRWEFVRDGEVIRAVRAVDTAVHPEHQGRGLFTALTMHGLDEIRADGVDFVFNTPNAKSRPGYLKMGWSDVGRLPVYIRPNGLNGAWAAARSREAASHWPSDGSLPGEPYSTAQMPFGVAGPATRELRTRTNPDFLSWRYGLPLLGYRRLDVGRGAAIVRVRARGRSRELALLHLHQVGPEQADEAVTRAASDSRATHVVALASSVRGRAWLRLPGLGPRLTWRGVTQTAPIPSPNWRLELGDIELF